MFPLTISKHGQERDPTVRSSQVHALLLLGVSQLPQLGRIHDKEPISHSRCSAGQMELTFYFSLSTYIAMRNINGNKLRGHLETMVLSMLEGGPAHGFELLRRLDSAGDGTLKMKEGSLYPALYRLEEAGVVTAKWEDGSSGRRGARRR